MWRNVLTFLRLRTPPALCLVMGADAFRYCVAGMAGTVNSEPATGFRHRKTQLIGAIGHGKPSCSYRLEWDWIRLLEGEVPIDAAFVERFCIAMSRRVRQAWPSLRPMSLLVTGRPDLMEQVATTLAEGARRAGFWSAEVVAERDCLALAAGADATEALLVDAGHLATRIYGPAGGVTIGHDTTGGRWISGAIGELTRQQHDMMIGAETSMELLRQLDSPQNWPTPIRGRSFTTGRPAAATLEHADVRQAVTPVFAAVAELCERVMQASGVAKHIFLAGGCAASNQLRSAIAERTGLPVMAPPEPAVVSLRGLARRQPVGR